MQYKFWDLTKEEVYNNLVLFITGPYMIFNNIAIDNMIERCKGEKASKEETELMKEFGIQPSGEAQTINSVSFKEFMSNYNTPSANGLWYCRVDYGSLASKEKEMLKKYLDNPSVNGRLVVLSTEFKEYIELLKDKKIAGSRKVGLIQLSFPLYKTLRSIINEKFKQEGIKVADKALDIFITKLGKDYNGYAKAIENVINKSGKNSSVTYKEMIGYLRGYESYDIDNIILEMIMGVGQNKIASNRKVYKMLGSLIDDIGIKKAAEKFKYRVDDLIEYRILVNAGMIPIGVRYSVEGIQEKLGEKHKLKKVSTNAFRKGADLACHTTLKDWTYIRLMLGQIDAKSSEAEALRAIYSITHRNVLGANRVLNDIGMKNTLNMSLEKLDSIKFKEKKGVFE